MDTAFGIETLSAREREVLALIARGLTNAQVAERLNIRFETAKWHVSEIISKLGVNSREKAAEEWRAWRRPSARAHRAIRALVGLGLAAKLGAGGVVGGALVAGVLTIGGPAGDGTPVPEPGLTVVPTPAPTRPYEPRPDSRDQTEPVGPFVDVTSAVYGGTTYTIGMYEAKFGLCMYVWNSEQGAPGTGGRMCVGPFTAPHLLSGHGGGPRGQGVLEGITPPEIRRVRITLYEGDPVELDTVAAPPELNVPWRFWIAAVARPDVIASVEGFDAAGNVLDSVRLYDPPGSPPRVTQLPPYEQVNFSGSGRDDPTTGTVGIGVGSSSFGLDSAAHDLRFAIEHDGTQLPSFLLWCQTGIIPLKWATGTSANGNGSFVVSIPAGNTACHWSTAGSGADGNWRIHALP